MDMKKGGSLDLTLFVFAVVSSPILLFCSATSAFQLQTNQMLIQSMSRTSRFLQICMKNKPNALNQQKQHYQRLDKYLTQCQHLTVLQSTSTRLFGSKAGVPGNPSGEIMIENVQDVLTDIDFDRLRSNMDKIRNILGYPTYDVNLYLVEDALMQETNRDTRGIDKPTDILSFPFHMHVEAGVLEEPDFDIPDYYTLGEMMVDVPYVIRRCQEDKEDGIEEDDEDRGVSGAMATIYDPEERINMLLVHGMLHLVGHDHEEDEEYEVMVQKEEEIMKELGMLPTSGSTASN